MHIFHNIVCNKQGDELFLLTAQRKTTQALSLNQRRTYKLCIDYKSLFLVGYAWLPVLLTELDLPDNALNIKAYVFNA